MSTPTNHKLDFSGLFDFKNEEKEIKHDSFMLMAAFLSEIELVQEKKSINRKTLAEKIGTSASYLTQVFRGDKPLNFATIARIKKALNIRFEVKAYPKNASIDSELFGDSIKVNKFHFANPKYYAYAGMKNSYENYHVEVSAAPIASN